MGNLTLKTLLSFQILSKNNIEYCFSLFPNGQHQFFTIIQHNRIVFKTAIQFNKNKVAYRSIYVEQIRLHFSWTDYLLEISWTTVGPTL